MDELHKYFDLVCDRIASHPSYAGKVEGAVKGGRQIVLNYHSHGPEQDFCVSVCAGSRMMAELGLPMPLEELAHIRGVGARAEECGPRMAAFAERLVERYGLDRPPTVYLEGQPFPG